MKTQWHGIGNSVLPQIPQIISRLFDLLQDIAAYSMYWVVLVWLNIRSSYF